MKELNKTYDPKEVEEKWYGFWEKNKFFSADNSSKKKSFTIILPPPNVTGSLHMGHALVDTLQDVLIRYKRMQGYETLWVPGTDHAGISTQTVVEKHLIKTTGKRRKEHTREEFLAHIWRWKEDKECRIIEQLQKLGCSCDWSRLRFTMDEKSNYAVRHMFKKMYDDGFIYQGDYLVNWDPATQTALSDDEVEYEQKNSSLWYFRYPLCDSDDVIVIATTRPETMLGDTAVAVNPKDIRYQNLIGKKISLPLTKRTIPIIADNFVDPEFGTGAVKITPAHDINDYEAALRHNLPMINIMAPNGRINEEAPAFLGLSMLEAREAIVKKMKKLNLLEKSEPYLLRVGVSYRSKAMIEPYLSKQWFINMQGFKKQLIAAVKEKTVTIIPPHWEEVYYHWIDNLRDWCISRQLWWGHRIPIWYNKENPKKMICHDELNEPEEVKKNPDDWYQDEDVLDTWFSSSIWPFSALGWPENTADLKKFYPTSVLVTGHDILFFWVARMIMMGQYALKTVPFHKAFIHGLIYGKSYWRQDKDGTVHYVPYKEKVTYDMGTSIPSNVKSRWEKMSKSKGNIIDPLEIIDIYGTDAMRFALCSSTTYARQIDLDRRRFEEFKNFSNKIWNASRFIFQQLTPTDNSALTKEEIEKGIDLSHLELEDKWILSRLNSTVKQINHFFETFSFDKASMAAYYFFWNDFCSYYLELIKPSLFGKSGTPTLKLIRQKLLIILLCKIIRLLHPFAPFITEEIFSYIKNLYRNLKKKDHQDAYTQAMIYALLAPACIVAPFPQVIDETHIDKRIENDFSFIEKIIYSIRNIRSELNIPLGMRTSLAILAKDEKKQLIENNVSMIRALTKTDTINLIDNEKDFPQLGSVALVNDIKLMLPFPKDMIEKEKNRLFKEKEKMQKVLDQTEAKLQNKDFIAKAPDHVVNQFKQNYQKTKQQLEEITEKLQNIY